MGERFIIGIWNGLAAVFGSDRGHFLFVGSRRSKEELPSEALELSEPGQDGATRKFEGKKVDARRPIPLHHFFLSSRSSCSFRSFRSNIEEFLGLWHVPQSVNGEQ